MIKAVTRADYMGLQPVFLCKEQSIYLFGILVEILDLDVFTIKETSARIQTATDLLEYFLRQHGKTLSASFRISISDIRASLKIIINGEICASDSLVSPIDEIIIFYPAEGAS
jgi:hypothetical protein